MDHKRFYKELGKLLYAVATVDGKIQDEEVTRLKQFVRDELAPGESSHDQFGTDNAFYTEFEFETLMDRGIHGADAYRSFLEYFRENKAKIEPRFIPLCLELADKVANAFQDTNAAELELMKDLRKQLS